MSDTKPLIAWLLPHYRALTSEPRIARSIQRAQLIEFEEVTAAALQLLDQWLAGEYISRKRFDQMNYDVREISTAVFLVEGFLVAAVHWMLAIAQPCAKGFPYWPWINAAITCMEMARVIDLSEEERKVSAVQLRGRIYANAPACVARYTKTNQ